MRIEIEIVRINSSAFKELVRQSKFSKYLFHVGIMDCRSF